MTINELVAKYNTNAQDSSLTMAILLLLLRTFNFDLNELDRTLTEASTNGAGGGGGSGTLWGAITGNIQTQTDLIHTIDQGVIHTKNAANNASTPIFQVPVLAGTNCILFVKLGVDGFDGTDLTSYAIDFQVGITNKAGTISVQSGSTEAALGGVGFATGGLVGPSGALLAFDNSASPVVFSFVPGDLGSNFAGGFLKTRFQVDCLSGQTITYL